MEGKEIRCNNGYCPRLEVCANYSTDAEQFNLIEKEFDMLPVSESDENGFFCETFEPIYK